MSLLKTKRKRTLNNDNCIHNKTERCVKEITKV